MGAGQRITAAENVPSDATFLFTVREADSGNEDEAILSRRDGEIAGWLNRCVHFRHVRIDKGSGAPKRNGELVCTNHGAMFEADTGFCTYGPCEGAYLEPVEIEVRDGGVYLTDGDYAFVRTGGLETDSADLSSKSNVEF